MKDDEKRRFYDAHGTEEEYREQHSNDHQYGHQADTDPFNLFEMFFRGDADYGNYTRRGYRVERRNENGEQYYYYQSGDGDREEQNNQNGQQRNPRGNKVRYAFLVQILSLVVIFLVMIGPSLYKSALN